MTIPRAALILHLVTTGWLLLNGTAHTAQVLWKARAGTLTHGASSVESLLAVGAGLLVAGAAYAYSAGGLMRSPVPSYLAAFLSWALLMAVIAAIARRYGFMFLGGTLLFAMMHLALISLAAWRVRGG